MITAKCWSAIAIQYQQAKHISCFVHTSRNCVWSEMNNFIDSHRRGKSIFFPGKSKKAIWWGGHPITMFDNVACRAIFFDMPNTKPPRYICGSEICVFCWDKRKLVVNRFAQMQLRKRSDFHINQTFSVFALKKYLFIHPALVSFARKYTRCNFMCNCITSSVKSRADLNNCRLQKTP